MRILTVQELTSYIKEKIESDPHLSRIWVRGEVTSSVYHPSGHLYFELQDQQVRLRVVMFRSQVARQKLKVEKGKMVVVLGRIGVYERSGSYQLYAQVVEEEGAGALHEEAERLKAQLQAEGLFDPKTKQALPKMPLKIGVVTSAAGAAIRDVLAVLKERWPIAEVILAGVAVQGETAPYEIAQGIRQLNESPDIDVLLVGRGGGAPEELNAFNTEIVARALFDSQIPVVSAVGHEKDFTIADLVADVRAATPSAAAEIVAPDQRAVREYLASLESTCIRLVTRHLQWWRLHADNISRHAVFKDPVQYVCSTRREQVASLQQMMKENLRKKLERDSNQLSLLSARLQALSPLNILARGYSVTQRSDGTVVHNAGQVSPAEQISVKLYKGKLLCTVEKVDP